MTAGHILGKFAMNQRDRLRSIEFIILATHNRGKIGEFGTFLRLTGWSVTTALALDLHEPIETGLTYQENALLKARAACEATGQVCLGDNSGLSITALGGQPGIYSARWAGDERDFSKAMARVHSLLRDKNDRSAAFICVLAIAFPGGATEFFRGEVSGEIIWPPRGEGGFGYDFIFEPSGYHQTFAELEEHTKLRLNHRARAFNCLLEAGDF